MSFAGTGRGRRGFVKWPRAVLDELELRRLSWNEYAMLSWLFTRADPYRGSVRTSWGMIALETGLSANQAEKLCRSLRGKGHVAYPPHPGAGRRLFELVLDGFPLAGGGVTDLAARRGGAAAEVPAEVASPPPVESRTWPPQRSEIREREQERERDRSVDRDQEASDARMDPVALRTLLRSQPWWRPDPEA